MLQTDEPLAIPLWINGHAYLVMAPDFLDITDPASGEVLRRTPLCGTAEAGKAIDAGRAALAAWAATSADSRAELLGALGEALVGYTDHFVRLIREETGKGDSLVATELAAAVGLLKKAEIGDVTGVVAVVGGDSDTWLGPLKLVVPALAAGATVILRPSPRAPSALLALAELGSRCGLPDGVFNILHGTEAAVEGLRTDDGVRLLFA
jgi:acyl-CoA reductase-like NAD-dependent aldehyde dehydrogenase